jgi:NADH:ubiquinone reductase (H+-translocating)
VIDRQNHHVFQPLLYWVATAGLSPADICSPIRSILRKQKNTEVFMEEVTGVDVEEQRVLMGDRSVPYDYLVLATGAHDNYFGHPEWEHCAPGLKSIVDATSLRRKILLSFETAEIETDPEKVKALSTFVLVGAGPTGVEMAGAIAELAHKTIASDFRHIDTRMARIILIEAAPRVLGAFPESLTKKTEKKLVSMGVEVRTGTPVEEVDAHGVVAGGERINASTIIWGAGVSASSAGKWLGAEVDRAGRVQVSSDLSVPGQPNVFVIGDTASMMQEGKLLPGVAQVAMQGGRYVASVINSRVEGKEMNKPFSYRDKGNLATIGRSYAIVEIGDIRLAGFLAWLIWLAVHIYFLVGFRNRLMAIFQWAWTYFTFDRGARLITFENERES